VITGIHHPRTSTKDFDAISHLKNAVEYVAFDQGADFWTWHFKDPSDDGMFARPVPEERFRKKRDRSGRRRNECSPALRSELP
jgi:hypothetical protein